MAGTVVVDAVKSSTTGAPTFQNTSGTEIGTLCRAWVKFVGSTGAISASFNVSSVTRTGTGTYTINFTNVMPDTNYATVASSAGGVGYSFTVLRNAESVTTSSVSITNVGQVNGTTGNIDAVSAAIAIFR